MYYNDKGSSGKEDGHDGHQGALSQIGSIFSGLFVTPDWRACWIS